MAQNTVKQGGRLRNSRATARSQLIFISLLHVKTAYRKLIRLVNLPSAFTRPRRQELQETWKTAPGAWRLAPGGWQLKNQPPGARRQPPFKIDNPRLYERNLR